MKQYKEYKKVTNQLISEIPTNWKMSKLKYSTEIYNGDSINSDLKQTFESEDREEYPYIGSKDIDVNFGSVDYNNGIRIPKSESKYKVAPAGSFLICIEGGSAGKKIAYLEEDVCFVNKLACINGDSKFYYYVSKSDLFRVQFFNSMTGLIGGVSLSLLKEFTFPLPPLPEQEKIVAFLDYKTERIDLLLKLKEEKIELLKQKRTALINEAVTKGINPNAPLKDSGIEWIGEIPEHWLLPQLGTVAANEQYSLTGGPFGSDLKSDEYTDEGIRIIQLQNIGVGQFLNSYKIYTSEQKANDLYSCNIYPGEIIIAKMADPVARACLMPDFDEKYLMASDGIRLKPNSSQYESQFLVFSINANYFRIQAELESTGSTRLRIGLTALKKLRIIAPPLEEQVQIVDYLNQHTQEIDALIKLEEDKIAALKDFRVALISEAVTGKIDVRDWQAPKTN